MVEDTHLLTQFYAATATDLRLLADLHASELTPERVQALRADGFPDALTLCRSGDDFLPVCQTLTDILQQLATDKPEPLLDELASDFAAIYLNGSLHAYPSESAWLDEEELVCQQPMFEVRAWYQQYGLAVPNWRRMADDHLVNELLFSAHLLQQDSAVKACHFMDEHLLRWLPQFCTRVAQRCATDFYAGLALLTLLYAEQLRDLLAEILEQPRPDPADSVKTPAAGQSDAAPPQPLHYYPGAAPGW